MLHSITSCTISDVLFLLLCIWVFSDDADDWDFDMCPKPSEVQNEMYVRDEDEEDEAEDLDGTKVMVR